MIDSETKFDAYADSYEAALGSALVATGEHKDYFAEQRLLRLERTLRKAGVPRPGRVLDFGSGTGGAFPFISQVLSPECIVGVDVSQASINVANRSVGHLGRSYVLGSPEAEACAGFDLVVCNGVFHHIAPQERQNCLQWIWTRLSPNGVFALFENNPWNPGTRYVMSRCAFDDDAICLSQLECSRRLCSAGFTVLARENLFFFPRTLSPLRPIEPSLAWLPLGGQYYFVCRR